MTEAADTTNPSTIHDIPPASPPGRGAPDFEPVAEMPDPFVPLGEAAAAIVDRLAEANKVEPDLIDEAKALEEMIRRDNDLWDRGVDYLAEDEERMLEAYNSSQAVTDASIALTAKTARSPSEVAAKASALVAALGDKQNVWYENMSAYVPLIVSTLRDAVSTGEISSEARAPSGNDSRLLDLMARHGLLKARELANHALYEQAHEAWLASWPPAPAALTFQAGDLGGELGVSLADRDDDGALRYGRRAVKHLEEMPPLQRISGKDGKGRHLFEVDPEAEARRAGILAAYRSWMAEREGLKVPPDLVAAEDETTAINAALAPIERAILDTTPRTFAGLRAKARWIADLFNGDAEYDALVLKDVLGMAVDNAVPAVVQRIDSNANPVLRALVEEFEAKLTEESALRATQPRVDCDKVPGWLALQDRLDEITTAMSDIQAESMADVLLASRFLLTSWIQDDQRTATDLGSNLAEDLLRLFGGGAVQPAPAEAAA